MKWYKPKTGTERTVRRIACWPTRLDDENSPVVWLEFYYARQVYQYNYNFGYYGWVTYTRSQDDWKLQFWDSEDRRKGWGKYAKNTV